MTAPEEQWPEEDTEPGRKSWCECNHNFGDLRIILQLLQRTDLKPEVLMLLGELAGHFCNESGVRDELINMALRHKHPAGREGAMLALARDTHPASRAIIEYIARHDKDRYVAPLAQRLLRGINQEGFVNQVDRVRFTGYKPPSSVGAVYQKVNVVEVNQSKHIDATRHRDFISEEITDVVDTIAELEKRKRR